jgi:hypothetical protein
MIKKQRRSLELTPANWHQLTIIAATCGALSERGPTAGEPSWRALVRMIAQGDIEATPAVLGDHEPEPGEEHD